MYLHDAALYKNHLVFVWQDSLWSVQKEGGCPQRLTAPIPFLKDPVFNKDGDTIFFHGSGEIYKLAFPGGAPVAITHLQTSMRCVGLSPSGKLMVSSNHLNPFRQMQLYEVEAGVLKEMPIGPCEYISWNKDGACVIQCHGYGHLFWKRYQGGTAACLWVDPKGDGAFHPILSHITHNLLRPIWIGPRIYFLSDHEGRYNLYSCDGKGEGLEKHTHHREFDVRHHSVYGNEVVYGCGGHVYLLNTLENQSQQIAIAGVADPKTHQLLAKNPKTYLSAYQPSPHGKQLAIITRGRLFQGNALKGPLVQRGENHGVRYRLVTWLKDGSLLVLADGGVAETWQHFLAMDHGTQPKGIWPVVGRATSVKSSKKTMAVAYTTHDHRLHWMHLETGETKEIAHSPSGHIQGYDWSPCGRWIVYAVVLEPKRCALYLYDTHNHTSHALLQDAFFNRSPSFDPEGEYIYFLSSRSYQPQWDALHFQLGFQQTVRPFLIALKKDIKNPFLKALSSWEQDILEADSREKKEVTLESEKAGDVKGNEDSATTESTADKEDVSSINVQNSDSSNTSETPKDRDATALKEEKETVIQFEGIQRRMMAFPLVPRNYTKVQGVKSGVIYHIASTEDGGGGTLYRYDFTSLKEEALLSSVDGFCLSADGQWITHEAQHTLYTTALTAKPDLSEALFDWNRVPLRVSPYQEWTHMFDEAWRLQKELFWTPSMGNIPWDTIYQRYRPCVDRVSCTSEFLSILWDLQGELGTSHAYVMFKSSKESPIAGLGTEIVFDATENAYRIGKVLEGDFWEHGTSDSMENVLEEGAFLWTMGGVALTQHFTPYHALEGKTSQPLSMTTSLEKTGEKNHKIVFPLSQEQEQQLRYRQWVNTNRQQVHALTDGRAGYIHIPDMGTVGYGEFMRSFLQEYDRGGLIIDVRFNGGGNVSPLILSLLTRKRLGHDKSRHQGIIPYPSESPRGPMVCLINEYTASDGDIFSHGFKTLGLGPLIGKRTWGGVVGIWPRYELLDGTITTQPEYSFWFHGVGWTLENKGVDPDIPVERSPNDYQKGEDPQLERAIREILLRIEEDEPRQRALETPPEEPVLWKEDDFIVTSSF